MHLGLPTYALPMHHSNTEPCPPYLSAQRDQRLATQRAAGPVAPHAQSGDLQARQAAGREARRPPGAGGTAAAPRPAADGSEACTGVTRAAAAASTAAAAQQERCQVLQHK